MANITDFFTKPLSDKELDDLGFEAVKWAIRPMNNHADLTAAELYTVMKRIDWTAMRTDGDYESYLDSIAEAVDFDVWATDWTDEQEKQIEDGYKDYATTMYGSIGEDEIANFEQVFKSELVLIRMVASEPTDEDYTDLYRDVEREVAAQYQTEDYYFFQHRYFEMDATFQDFLKNVTQDQLDSPLFNSNLVSA